MHRFFDRFESKGGGVLYKDLKYNVGSIEIEHLMFVNFLLKRYTYGLQIKSWTRIDYLTEQNIYSD